MGATGGNRASRVFWKAQAARDVLGFGFALAARQFTTKNVPELGFGNMTPKNLSDITIQSMYNSHTRAGASGKCSQQAFNRLGIPASPRDWSEHASNAKQGLTWMIEIWALRLLSGLLLLLAFWPRMFFPASTRKSQITNYAYARPRSQYQANARGTANDHR